MTNSEMDIRGYKPADETYYSYKDEEEAPRAVHNEKVDDEDLKPYWEVCLRRGFRALAIQGRKCNDPSSPG